MTNPDNTSPSNRDRRSLRDAAAEIAARLRDAGHVAYFAGGCVRDQILGLQPKDFDVATDATPEQIVALFPRTRGVGQAFGVVLVTVFGRTIEVTTFRSDGVYSDGRHPDAVVYADAPSDARRRDFTINGLFQDPFTNEIIDYVGGREDLARGVIRAIGDPHDRFHEDRLRMLRAVRFAARYAFEIETQTAEAIRTSAGELRGVSRERIGQEVEWMLSASSRATAAALMQSFGLDRPALAESNLECSLPRLIGLPATARYPAALAAWWLDRRDADGGPADGRPPWRDALTLSNRTCADLLEILRTEERLRNEWDDLAVAGRKRVAATSHFSQALALVETTDPARAARIGREVCELEQTGICPPPLVGGADLIEIGLRPGPQFGPILDAVYDAQLEGRIHTRNAALALAESLARTGAG